MTDRRRYYDKELSKRVVINLTIADYNRWKAAADIKGQKIATMVRNQTENYITELENDWEMKITDIIEYQESLKNGGIII